MFLWERWVWIMHSRTSSFPIRSSVRLYTLAAHLHAHAHAHAHAYVVGKRSGRVEVTWVELYVSGPMAHR